VEILQGPRTNQEDSDVVPGGPSMPKAPERGDDLRRLFDVPGPGQRGLDAALDLGHATKGEPRGQEPDTLDLHRVVASVEEEHRIRVEEVPTVVAAGEVVQR